MSETIQTTEEKKKLIAEEIERYDIKTESKLLKALGGIFEEMTCLVNEEDIRHAENITAVDLEHVCMVTALTGRAKLILRRFYNPEAFTKEPTLSFRDSRNVIMAGDSMYSTDYMVKILKVFEAHDDHFRIRLGTEYPCIIDSEDFRFLLAPRIDSE